MDDVTAVPRVCSQMLMSENERLANVRERCKCVGTAFPITSPQVVSDITKRKEPLACSGVPVFMKMLSLVGVSYAGIRGQPFSGRASLGWQWLHGTLYTEGFWILWQAPQQVRY